MGSGEGGMGWGRRRWKAWVGDGGAFAGHQALTGQRRGGELGVAGGGRSGGALVPQHGAWGLWEAASIGTMP